MFRVKICGITSVDDALMVCAAGADAIGLNFYGKSPRCVDLELAEKIAAVVRGHLALVGVFVNAPLDTVVQIADRLPLDFIQLHGDEPSSQIQELAPRHVIRAVRLGADSEKALLDQIASDLSMMQDPKPFLVDAFKRGEYGGTGKTADWGSIHRIRKIAKSSPVILAGGLTPSNVANAIKATHCDGVDTASGVESAPGRKDASKTQQFVRAALAAFDAIGDECRL